MHDLSIRQRIKEALKGNLLTARDISRTIGIKEKDVFEHLGHVARSVGSKARFVIEPSECMDCGFVFRKRDRLKTPGRCPICKSEGITEVKFGIKED